MRHIIPIALMVLSHYGCCHHLVQLVLDAYIIQKTPLPDPTTRPPPVETNDVVSLIYNTILSEYKADAAYLQPPSSTDETVCAFPPENLPPPSPYFMILLIGIPTVAFISLTIPSLYAHSSFGMKPLRNANAILVIALLYALIAMGSDWLTGSRFLSTVLAMHMSIRLTTEIVELVGAERCMVLQDTTKHLMSLLGAMICFAISILGHTSLSSYNSTNFYQAHLLSILSLELGTPTILWVATMVARLV
jgi:hypothetical protein